MTKRISRGFHRLAILLAAPVVAAAIAISAYAVFFSTEGDTVPDPTAKPVTAVLAIDEKLTDGQPDPRGPWDKFIPADPDVLQVKIGTREAIMKPVSGSPPLRKASVKELSDGELLRLANAIEAFTLEERRRGVLFQPASMPVLVGDVLVYYPSGVYSVYDRTGMKIGTDWRTLNFSAIVLALAGLVYAAIRGIGWVVAGFLGGE